MADNYARLSAAAMRGLGRLGKGPNGNESRAAIRQAEELGIYAVGRTSTDEQLADFVEKLWASQDDLADSIQKEMVQHLHYCANESYIAYHRDQRRWVARKTVPWRIRSRYNVVQKAVNIRVARLVENKPSCTVQARTASRDDIDRAERQEQTWWYLWAKLSLHQKMIFARRWASKCGSSFLKGTWNADAGEVRPATRKVPRFVDQPTPATGPDGQPLVGADGAPIMGTTKVYDGLEELYLDAQGQELGPTSELVEDPEHPGQTIRRPIDPPDEADYIAEGLPDISVRPPFSIRWDRYVDDPADSWYLQDSELMPGTAILARWPDALDALKRAKPAGEGDRLINWTGFVAKGNGDLGSYGTEATVESAASSSTDPLNRDYIVRETWIFPKDAWVRRLWGKKGAIVVTVGGVLIDKPRPLPEWALKKCPFIKISDTPEEGNHYDKSFLRDLIPLQDDINRTRSHQAEHMMVRSRLLIGAPQGHQMNLRVMAGLPGAFLTYRSTAHEPKPIEFGASGANDFQQYYRDALEAAADVAMINDASVGKLPSAGIAAKAIYALQYADERSIVEISAHQDEALKRLAELLLEICRCEFTEARSVRITGPDQSFLVESEVSPYDFQTDVDITFTPGSMLSRQKEAVKNELLELRREGLVDDATVKKNLPVAVPDAFRQSYDLQYAKARRQLAALWRGEVQQVSLDPWQDPAVVVGVCEEYMLSSRWDVTPDPMKSAVGQLWQSGKVAIQMQQQQAQAAAMAAAGGAAGGPGGAATAPVSGRPGQPAGKGDNGVAEGASALEAKAAQEMSPPKGYGAQ